MNTQLETEKAFENSVETKCEGVQHEHFPRGNLCSFGLKRYAMFILIIVCKEEICFLMSLSCSRKQIL